MKFFIRKFQGLDPATDVVIMPEGTHRYYLHGQEGRVGASWMTKEVREKDIEDNHRYLDIIHEHFIPKDFQGHIAVLGFSQGAATATRWAAETEKKVDRLILWASVFPPDLKIPERLERINSLRPILLIGDQDQYYSQDLWINAMTPWRQAGIDFEELQYSGGHQVEAPVLDELRTRLS